MEFCEQCYEETGTTKFTWDWGWICEECFNKWKALQPSTCPVCNGEGQIIKVLGARGAEHGEVAS